MLTSLFTCIGHRLAPLWQCILFALLEYVDVGHSLTLLRRGLSSWPLSCFASTSLFVVLEGVSWSTRHIVSVVLLRFDNASSSLRSMMYFGATSCLVGQQFWFFLLFLILKFVFALLLTTARFYVLFTGYTPLWYTTIITTPGFGSQQSLHITPFWYTTICWVFCLFCWRGDTTNYHVGVWVCYFKDWGLCMLF